MVVHEALYSVQLRQRLLKRKDLKPWKDEEKRETSTEVEAGRREVPKGGEGVGRHGVQHAGRRWKTG